MSYQFGHVDRDERIDLAADEPVGETARWGGLPTPLVTAAVMAVFAGALWFAYHEGTRHPSHVATPAPAATAAAAPSVAAPGMLPAGAETAPLIRADPRPMKIKPENPGGMPVPDRDRLIYGERPGGPPVERLLPPPEQPMPRPAPPPAAALPPVAQAPVAPQPKPASARTLPAEPGRKPLAAAPVARPERATPPIHEVRGGRFRVQLASLRTPDEARTEWQRLKRLQPDLLGGLTADAVRADLGQRGVWYRIVAGGFANAATARRLCHELKERHLGCSIVR